MFKKIAVCWALVALSCTIEENPNYSDVEPSCDAAVAMPRSVWVCYNPGSDFHGKQCDDQQEPGQCLTSGDSSKFCWKLNVEDCFSNPRDLLYNEICAQINQQ
jgi:hypothetical protein